MTIYRVGIIGGGRQGTGHARAYYLHPRTEVVAVADTDPENLELFCERFKVPGYSTYDEMFSAQEVDISAPILPVSANPDAVVASAEAGVKAVFSEKPLAGSLADADRMVDACKSRGIPFAAGLLTSSHTDYRNAYRMAAEGEIGDVLRINLYGENGQMGTHGLNHARKFADKADVEFVIGWTGGEPFAESQVGFGNSEKGYGGLGGYIKFKNGVECFTGFPGPLWRGIEVIGTLGVISNANNTGLGLNIWKVPDGDATNSEIVEMEGVFESLSGERERDDEGWRKPSSKMMETIDDIVESLDTGKTLDVTTGDDLRHALEIAIALRESARRGKVPVNLPIEDRGIRMLPIEGRWFYKKDVHGVEWYRDQMKAHIGAPS